ncbi:MAG TPA: isoprenylcysteine carboxylmethyltransferase family protein [Candidatus Eisenbacteria bacterium]|nr:isoprenylcysteine carboxylmethyltransferase family protein [Candidatus Eisenbacteria bacterium]
MILGVGFLFLIPILLYHRIRSQATRERLDRREEGLVILLTLRPLALLFVICLVAYILDPSTMSWSSLELPGKLRALGALGGIVGGILLVWTLHTLGKNLTDTVVTRKAHMLIMHGPYLWVRHPFYDAVALLILAASLIAANWFLLLTGALALGLIYIRTRKEEELLLARFGEHYRAYMRRTGRFLPNLH